MNVIVFCVYILLLLFNTANGFGYLQSGNHSRIKMSSYQINHSRNEQTHEEIQINVMCCVGRVEIQVEI